MLGRLWGFSSVTQLQPELYTLAAIMRATAKQNVVGAAWGFAHLCTFSWFPCVILV